MKKVLVMLAVGMLLISSSRAVTISVEVSDDVALTAVQSIPWARPGQTVTNAEEAAAIIAAQVTADIQRAVNQAREQKVVSDALATYQPVTDISKPAPDPIKPKSIKPGIMSTIKTKIFGAKKNK